jgi:hypothetical protein
MGKKVPSQSQSRMKQVVWHVFKLKIQDELAEVVGSHVKKFKQATLKQIQLLKDIFKCKCTKFNPETPEHEALLRRLVPNLKQNIIV